MTHPRASGQQWSVADQWSVVDQTPFPSLSANNPLIAGLIKAWGGFALVTSVLTQVSPDQYEQTLTTAATQPLRARN